MRGAKCKNGGVCRKWEAGWERGWEREVRGWGEVGGKRNRSRYNLDTF